MYSPTFGLLAGRTRLLPPRGLQIRRVLERKQTDLQMERVGGAQLGWYATSRACEAFDPHAVSCRGGQVHGGIREAAAQSSGSGRVILFYVQVGRARFFAALNCERAVAGVPRCIRFASQTTDAPEFWRTARARSIFQCAVLADVLNALS